MPRLSPVLLGPLLAALATFAFSVNDVVIKFLAGGYALHQLVLFRSLVGMGVVLLVLVPFGGGWRVLRTKRPLMQFARASCVFVANLLFFMGLVALPLAEAVAIFFLTPFVITIFSIVFLGETVGRRRWSALILGFIGVLIVMRPGTAAFQPAALYVVGAACAYAGLHTFTRAMRGTENAISMVFFIQLTFICATGLLGLILGGGRFAGPEDPSLDFLLRAWSSVNPSDIPLILLIGTGASLGGLCISQAYRLGEAAYIAPVEYLALPLSILWGIFVFGEYPDLMTYLGTSLILGAGLYAVWREARVAPRNVDGPTRR